MTNNVTTTVNVKSFIQCALTVLPAKSDSNVMFCLKHFQGLTIGRSLVHQSYPQDRITTQVIYRSASGQVECASYLFYLAIINPLLRYCHSWFARQYMMTCVYSTHESLGSEFYNSPNM